MCLLIPLVAHGQQGDETFRMPSGNVGCYFSAMDGSLRCDVIEATQAPPERPDDCELDWGAMFDMTTHGEARRICAGDTVAGSQAPLLEYGRTWTRAGFECVSRSTGLHCTNAAGHGWQLSRTEQTLF